MPVYDYRCCECETTFEARVRTGEAVACPRCGGSTVKKLFSVPTVLKGQSAQSAGHTCCGRAERCDTHPVRRTAEAAVAEEKRRVA